MSEIQIAKILRPHGVKGAVKVSVNLPDIPFSVFKQVYLGKSKIPSKITKIMPLNGFYSVMLDTIKSCNDAETYRNQPIYVKREDYDVFDDIILSSEYIGMEVKTKDGKYVGVVVDVENYGSADIISINCGGTTYMVPFVEDTLQIDKSNKIFIIDYDRFLEIRV
ncbi:MAG: 16S rRNA processing protein RimM [Clostridia bacterium]|nr:16S rRNA processing protein RimM [Clostridia bacterium]